MNGRNDVTYEERMMLVLYYVEHASLWMDIKIIFKTITVVLTESGVK